MPHRLVLAAVAASTAILTMSPALAERCRDVDGRLISRVVETFSNGKPCTSPLGVCTEGRFTGDLKGRFRFTSRTLQSYSTQDPDAPLDVTSLTGFFKLSPRKLCNGTLTLFDTSAYSFGPDGSYSSIETITSGTGTCEDVGHPSALSS